MNAQDFDLEGEIVKLLPQLRAFATRFTRGRDSDDLVQDALERAIRSRHTFVPGTNLKAWMFTILRHQAITASRRRRPVLVGDDSLDAPTPPSQDDTVALREFARLIGLLPMHQREALLLVGASGCSYEEAARIARSTVGTMKSRVSRARATLYPHFVAATPVGCTPIPDTAPAPQAAPKQRRRRPAPIPAADQPAPHAASAALPG